jgi:hypothetical protein
MLHTFTVAALIVPDLVRCPSKPGQVLGPLSCHRGDAVPCAPAHAGADAGDVLTGAAAAGHPGDAAQPAEGRRVTLADLPLDARLRIAGHALPGLQAALVDVPRNTAVRYNM